ncbi:MAG: class I SAM-dependent methyltransferase [Mesorhizobium sp.]|nr:class I SAM-dependent methyltransferase [Mesorhizobium sp.]
MTALRERLVRLIEATGPLSVADYMAQCLFDPEQGYYTTREPFGVSGDFITAPEISQMFGELVAVWTAGAWRANGSPKPFVLAEIGPGRGTLTKDLLRALARIAPDMLAAARVQLIETSPRLTEIQKQNLAEAPVDISWATDVDTLPDVPLIIIGNELFDAVPQRQYVKTDRGWRERMVGLDAGGNLCFAAGAGALESKLLPVDADTAPEGAIFELAPARSALMARIAARIERHGGAGLFFDYGYEGPALGDTLQALRRHAPDDVLAHPGEADLTSHVDFAALAQAAWQEGLTTRFLEQGAFLLGMGLLERAGALGAQADAATRQRLQGEVDRLARPEQMGSLFKVLMVHRTGLALPPGQTVAD